MEADVKTDLNASMEERIQTLERTQRILKKQLARSEKTRAEMETANQRREHMLRQSLKNAEAYSHKLAEAKAELITLNQQLKNRIEVESAALDEVTDSLQQAKVSVANSEKFSTLGELVAGVAHEINNPISCITSNIKFVDEYTQQLLAHIALQQSILESQKNAITPANIETVKNHAEDIELEYIEEDLPALIKSMETSGRRITEISQSLRTFARADTTQKQLYDIHEGIDGTLMILRHRTKAIGNRKAIEICKSYGELPSIYCYPGQINQVFMNIIANAIDATGEGEKTSGSPQILIESTMAPADFGQQLVVSITDNAGGMPESIRERIFENQFTTKRAGKGTGLGLSIARQIVEDTHKGKISCQATLGIGTTFRIALPIEAPVETPLKIPAKTGNL